jgi:nitrate/nitrite transporter NarK
VTAILAIGASYFPKNRALMTGSVSFAYGIGSFIGPVATARLLSAFDWKMPFIVFGLLGVVAMAMVAVGVRSWFSEGKGNAEQQVGDDGRSYPAGDSNTIWNPVTVLLGFAAISAGVGSFGLAGLYPTYMRNALGFTPQQAAGVMSMIGIGGFLAPLGGWLGDRLGYQRVLMIALPLMGLAGCIAFSELNKSVVLHSMVALLYGVAVLTLLYSNMSAIIISSMKPSMTARTSGLFIAAYYIPAAFAGYLLAEIKEATNWSTAGITQTAGFALLSMILIIAAGMKSRPAITPAKA